jgi:hypothetical protein
MIGKTIVRKDCDDLYSPDFLYRVTKETESHLTGIAVTWDGKILLNRWDRPITVTFHKYEVREVGNER